MKASIGRFPKNPKATRKVNIKVDKWDSWNADQTIAMIAHPVLVQLKTTKQGAPCVDDEDVPEELRSYNSEPGEDEYDVDSNHFNRWNYVLDEMIWSMKEISEGYPTEDSFYDWSACEECDNRKERYKKLKIDHEGLQQYHERVDKGCMLFGKYFRSLWD